MHQYKILIIISIIINILFMLLVIYMIYDGRDKNTNSQWNGSIKYISNTHEDVMQNEIYYN